MSNEGGYKVQRACNQFKRIYICLCGWKKTVKKYIKVLNSAGNFFFFLMWTTSKVFTEFVTTLFLFHVLAFLAMRPVGSHAPPVGSLWEPAAPVLEG